MTDILIRGMEMPERCDAKCPLYNTARGYYDCNITKRSYNWGLIGRPSDCPLHELPEHGDLIDRSETLKAMEWTWAGKAAFEAVKDVPAVIPSNKEDTP